MTCEHHENEDIGNELAKLGDYIAKGDMRIGPCTLSVTVEDDEENEEEKLNALEKAMGLVGGKCVQQILGMDLYLGRGVRCIAYMGEGGGSRKYSMFLGNQMLQKTAKQTSEKKSGVKGGYGGGRGVADQVYDKERKSWINPKKYWRRAKGTYQSTKVSAKAVAVVVHELGHILHEKTDSDIFWQLKKTWGPEGAPPAQIAMQVSEYSMKSKLEFVAEVFTGRIYGTVYGPEVLALFEEYGGPELR